MENTWDKIFKKNIEENKVENKGTFSPYLPYFDHYNGTVLDIGTGFGEDAVYLSKKNKVYATDYSEVAIKFNKEKNSEIDWIVHDTTKPFPFEDRKFDLINAFLSLHYFTSEQLDSIFSEVFRMSKQFSTFIYSIKIEEKNKCDTGKVQVSIEEHRRLITKHFKSVEIDRKKQIYCNNECDIMTFFIAI